MKVKVSCIRPVGRDKTGPFQPGEWVESNKDKLNKDPLLVLGRAGKQLRMYNPQANDGEDTVYEYPEFDHDVPVYRRLPIGTKISINLEIE